MPKLAPEAQQARRDHILDAAERCFVEKGFHPATMADICREASVSPGAIYIYFVSKEELIAGLCEREMERFAKELGTVAEASDFLAALQSLAGRLCCDEPLSKVRLHVEIRAEAGRNAAIRMAILEMDRVISRAMISLIEQEIALGRINPSLSPETIVRAMFALGDGLFLKRGLDPGFEPEPVIPAMMTMISALLQPARRQEDL
jgi:AcrR family transcriptional regulator